MPPANPIAPSAHLPPKAIDIGLRCRNNAVGNTSRKTPIVSLKTSGSARAISKMPIGTPARPAMTNGQTRRKSMLFQIDGKVESCAMTEQTSTSGTASVGGST